MNTCNLVGRIVKDPEIKDVAGHACTQFTLACPRRFKDNNGVRQADFINCVAWNQTAKYISTYCKKGTKLGLAGYIQTRSYEDNNGIKHYITEVVVDMAEVEERAPEAVEEQKPVEQPTAPVAPNTQIAPSMENDFEGLPFDVWEDA